MSRFGRKSSSDIAVERLKLVLVHDRMGAGPDRNIITQIKRDIVDVLSKYVEVDVTSLDVEIRQSGRDESGYAAHLTAEIPIRKIK
ncbi:MAG: cell division topological specificity factor MinE [Eubacteriales bacterium]